MKFSVRTAFAVSHKKLLGFLHLNVHFFPQIVKFWLLFLEISFLLLSLLSFWDFIMCVLVQLMMFRKSLKLSSLFFILFSSSNWVILNDLSFSSSILCFLMDLRLLLNTCCEFFNSVVFFSSRVPVGSF